MLIWRERCSIGGKIMINILPNLSGRTCMRMYGTRSLILADSLCVGTKGGVVCIGSYPTGGEKEAGRRRKDKKGKSIHRGKTEGPKLMGVIFYTRRSAPRRIT